MCCYNALFVSLSMAFKIFGHFDIFNIFPEPCYSGITHHSFVGLKYCEGRVDKNIFWKMEHKSSADLVI